MSNDQALRCLDGPDDCDGDVEYREPLSGTGRSFPRCDHHWSIRLYRQEQVTQRYGGATAPAGFDPSYAGERWDED